MSDDIVDDKADPADVVRIAYAALLAGEYEVSADDRSRQAKQQLSSPLEDIYPRLARPRNHSSTTA